MSVARTATITATHSEVRIPKWSKAVKERRDESGKQEENEEIERHPGHPDIKPPEIAHYLHQPENEKQERDAERGGQHGLFKKVYRKEFRSHAIEAEPSLEDERAIDREW
jgi:hypothetical protein